MKYVIVYMIIMNLVTCILYGIDKLMAMIKKRRIPEKVLIGFALFGGSLGALLGMQGFRHKTRHKKFQVCIPVFLILHICLFLYLLQFRG